MKLELGKFYRYIQRNGQYREGQYECIKIYRNKARLRQEGCLTIIDVPCSIVFIKPTSQIFVNYKNN